FPQAATTVTIFIVLLYFGFGLLAVHIFQNTVTVLFVFLLFVIIIGFICDDRVKFYVCVCLHLRKKSGLFRWGEKPEISASASLSQTIKHFSLSGLHVWGFGLVDLEIWHWGWCL